MSHSDALVVDREGLRALTRDLIRIPSVTPPGGEGPVARLLQDRLERLGLTVETYARDPARPNLVARLPGSEGHPVLLLNGHMDVLAPGHGWTRDPFGAEEEDGRIYGRGALDMKAGLAAMVYVADTLRRNRVPLRGDLVLAMVADEVGGSRLGTGYLVETGRLQADWGVVCEPTGPAIYLAHRGALWLELTVTGRSAHGGRPWRGVNAVVHAARLIQALTDTLVPTWGSRTHPLLPSPTLNVGTIAGGEQPNLVPDRCVVTLDRRLLPGESVEEAEAEIHDFIAGYHREDGGAWGWSLRRLMAREPYEIAADAPLVREAEEAYRAVYGRPPRLSATAGFEDAGLLARTGMAVIMFGPYYTRDEDDGTLSGSSSEYVVLDELVAGTRILTDLAIRMLR